MQNLNFYNLLNLTKIISKKLDFESFIVNKNITYIHNNDIETYYNCSEYTKACNFNKLQKCILLTNKIPELNDYIDFTFSKEDIDYKNSEGWTGLIICSRNINTLSNIDTLKILLNKNPNINLQNNLGATALNYAVCNSSCDSSYEAVKLLLVNGADPFIEDYEGKNVILHAIENYPKWCNEETLILLLDKIENHDINIGGQKLIKLLYDMNVNDEILLNSFSKGAKFIDLLDYEIQNLFYK